jgi:hypothetical protein
VTFAAPDARYYGAPDQKSEACAFIGRLSSAGMKFAANYDSVISRSV